MAGFDSLVMERVPEDLTVTGSSSSVSGVKFLSIAEAGNDCFRDGLHDVLFEEFPVCIVTSQSFTVSV